VRNSSAWRPPLRAWLRWKRRALADIPRPTDRAVASVPGDPAIECVAIGAGPLASWGVASHQLGLVGATARALARRFGCGAVVRATADDELSVRDMARPAAELPWSTARVGILSLGPMDVLRYPGEADWLADLESLVAAIRSRMPCDSILLVLGMPPIRPVLLWHGIGNARLDALIGRFDALAAELCARTEGVRFVPLPATGRGTPDHYRDAADYAVWGDLIAGAVPDFDPAAVPAPSAPEEDRAAAVERLGLLDPRSEARFDRLVHLARSVFRTRAAAFTVLHGDRQEVKALVGGPVPVTERGESLCQIAVAQGAPLVIGDLTTDPRLSRHDLVRRSGVRFYAGFPVRAPDGHFIGALCVFDPEPRDPADVDVATLRELALLVEAELEPAD